MEQVGRVSQRSQGLLWLSFLSLSFLKPHSSKSLLVSKPKVCKALNSTSCWLTLAEKVQVLSKWTGLRAIYSHRLLTLQYWEGCWKGEAEASRFRLFCLVVCSLSWEKLWEQGDLPSSLPGDPAPSGAKLRRQGDESCVGSQLLSWTFPEDSTLI